MKAFELEAEVDEKHRLSAVLPGEASPGRVRVIVLVPDTTESKQEEEAWMQLVTQEWHEELADEREDVYAATDGEPVDAPR